MRVLYVVNSGQIVGGIETNLLGVIERAQDHGLQVAGVLAPSQGKFTDMVDERQVPVRFVDYHQWDLVRPWRYLQTYWQLVRCLRQLQPHIIHFTHPWLVEYAWGLKHLVKQPVICDVANLDDESYVRQRERYLAALDRVIVRSQAIKENLTKYASRPLPVSLIYNGINTDSFIWPSRRLSLRRDLGFSQDTPLVGFVGRLVLWKGVEDLLVAWTHVVSAYPAAQLVIIGEDEQNGSYQRQLEHQAADLGIASSVHFLGFRTDIAGILNDLDVFVLSSHNEPFGLVTVEAMAAGCLVVATEGGGSREIVVHQETGCLVPVGHSLKLSTGIKFLLALPKDRAEVMRHAAQQRAQELFGIDQQMSRQMELYRELVAW